MTQYFPVFLGMQIEKTVSTAIFKWIKADGLTPSRLMTLEPDVPNVNKNIFRNLEQRIKI